MRGVTGFDDRRPRRVRRSRRPDEISVRASSASSPVRYDFPNGVRAKTDAYFTNKAPGGIAYRCSFRVTEASFMPSNAVMDISLDELYWIRSNCASGTSSARPAKRDTRIPADDHDRSGESLLPQGGGRVAPREAAADDHD